MAELKTKPTRQSVDRFLATLGQEQRQDCETLSQIMQKATASSPAMWGAKVVGFGQYHYKYASGREGDWYITGFSPQNGKLTIYIMPGFESYGSLMEKLGRYKTGRSCLYIKGLNEIHLPTLKKLITQSVRDMKKTYRCA